MGLPGSWLVPRGLRGSAHGASYGIDRPHAGRRSHGCWGKLLEVSIPRGGVN